MFGKGKVAHKPQETHTAGAYPGFCSMKQLRVLLLPPGWDASPSQGYPQQYVTGTHLCTWVERDNVGYSFLSKETTRWQGLGVEPPTFRSEVQRANHYTTAPPQKMSSNLKNTHRKGSPVFQQGHKTEEDTNCKAETAG